MSKKRLALAELEQVLNDRGIKTGIADVGSAILDLVAAKSGDEMRRWFEQLAEDLVAAEKSKKEPEFVSPLAIQLQGISPAQLQRMAEYLQGLSDRTFRKIGKAIAAELNPEGKIGRD
jgi:hypothetical protein